MKTLMGTDEYGYEVYKITSNEPMKFFCEHCRECSDTEYYETGVTWCKLCITTIKIKEK